jgi:hypothetical protein
VAVRAARHREIDVERDIAAVPAVARRNRADHDAGVEHMVVQREIVGRNDGGAASILTSPMGRAKLRRRQAQCRLVGHAGPVLFKRGLQLAVNADAWKAQSGDGERCFGHGISSITAGGRG